ncbi:hypothetical protein KCU67_g9097, partial [Aureobasidium melanogenum]
MPSVKFNASEPTPKMPKAPKKTGIEGFKASIKKENAQRKKEFEEQKKCVTDDDDDKQLSCLADDLKEKAKIGK